MKLQIKKAWYGSPNIVAVDVTDAVKAIAEQSTIFANVKVDLTTLGITDPDPGVVKSLTVIADYPDTSVEIRKSGIDGETLCFSTSSNPMLIFEATYGSGNIFIDIEDSLKRYLLSSINNHILTVGDNNFNNLFCNGKDIDPGKTKVLTVSFQGSIDHKQKTVCISDGQEFDVNKFAS